MPSVLRFRNYDVRINPLDHPPAHVHAVGPGWVVIVYLEPLTIREFYGDTTVREARQLVRQLAQYREFLLTEWSRIHG
jgi:hypothetical protein